MHGIGAHSAIAIKRQRRRHEQHRGRRPRRTPSEARHQQEVSNKAITMFHVGTVFLLVGLFLTVAAIMTNESNPELAELTGTGIVCLVIGLFLIILNRFYGQKEDEALQSYVEARLARTTSGQRLYHETDSFPEHLDAEAKTPSVEEGLNNSKNAKSKSKNNNKKKIPGPDSTSGEGPSTRPTVHIINEHHQNHSKGVGGSRGEGDDTISPGGVMLNTYRVYNSTTA